MNRKYRHRGYQDEDRDERERTKAPPRKPLSAEERIQKKSLRHAIDRDARAVLRCHDCGRDVQTLEEITTETQCPHCRTALHCCRACAHFNVAAPRQCSADIAKAVDNKIAANQCPEYRPKLVLDVTGRRSKSGAAADPKAAFDSLFKS